MNEKIVQAVLERSQGLCENCYGPGEELHHICFGSGKRKQCETKDSVVLLCYSCHRGTNGTHGKNGRKLDLKLKIRLQEVYFNQGYTEDEVREKMGGKLYLEGD